MEWQVVWFLLAGFLLGFACSTLWEWLYYRGMRQRKLALLRAEGQTNVPSVPTAGDTPAPDSPESLADASYRSPAVFIEGEELPVTLPASQPTYEPVHAPWNAASAPMVAPESTPANDNEGPQPTVEPVEQTAT